MNSTQHKTPSTPSKTGVDGVLSSHCQDLTALLAPVARDLLATASAAPGLVSVAMPHALLTALSMRDGSLRERASLTWEQPAAHAHLFGIGEARTVRGEGDITSAIPALKGVAITVSREVARSARPRFFGGARFDPATATRDARWECFGDWQFRLPVFLVVCSESDPAGSVTIETHSGENVETLVERLQQQLRRPLREDLPAVDCSAPLTPDEWQATVSAALDAIEAGAYEKVVLARAKDIDAGAPVNVPSVLATLRERYPTCYVFSFTSGDATWLGASPELLISLRNGVARAASLAGSRPRGRNEEDDCRLARELLGSQKERAEHGFVVDASRAALAPVATTVEAADEPGLMRMTNIQHLYTPIRAEVAPGVEILDLVGRMHPTPAVGAWPRAAAFDTLPRLERMDRGWYAAPIGWVDMDGDGEFAVALRSALVRGHEARLYAGAGIVAGSVPMEELEETRLKLRPLAEALRES